MVLRNLLGNLLGKKKNSKKNKLMPSQNKSNPSPLMFLNNRPQRNSQTSLSRLCHLTAWGECNALVWARIHSFCTMKLAYVWNNILKEKHQDQNQYIRGLQSKDYGPPFDWFNLLHQVPCIPFFLGYSLLYMLGTFQGNRKSDVFCLQGSLSSPFQP